MADNKKLAILDSEVAEARMVARQTAQAAVMESAMGEQLPYTPIETVNGKGGRQVNLGADDVGLGNVDNTRDANKPVSAATQQAMDAMEQLMQGLEDAQEAMRQVVGKLSGQVQAAAAGSAEAQQELEDSMAAIQQVMAGLAPLMDAPLAGRPTAPTPDGTVAQQLVTVEFVLAQIQKLIGAAPAALDDLGEIAARFKADEDAVASIVQQLGGKQAASPVLAIYAALSVGLNQLIIGTGNGGLKATDTSALGRQLLAADAPAALQALGAAQADDPRLAGAVRGDISQTLTSQQQATARGNIGAVAADDSRVAGAVRSDVPQSLSATAQQQARSNIGAAAGDDARLSGAVRADAAQSLTTAQQVQARNNIGAPSTDDPRIAGAVRSDVAQNLTVAAKAQARTNVGAVGTDDERLAGAVRSDVSQSLSTAQKAQARGNIGAASADDERLAGAVRSDTAQTLTAAQKTQAQTNIGAAAADDARLAGAVRSDTSQTLATAAKTQARTNIGAAASDDARLTGAVRMDTAQALTSAQQQQARDNIGAGPALGPLLGTPVARTDFALVAVGATPNVYQATQPTKPANIVLNVNVDYSVTLASTMADTLELRMGPTAADVTGATAKSFAKIWRSSLTGIAVSVGMGAGDGSPVDIMLPAGWYFAIVRKLGTRATIVSAFDQPIG